MLYNLSLSYVAAAFMGYLYILNFKNNKNKSLRTKIFTLLILMNGIFILTDILIGIFFKYTDNFFMQRLVRQSRWIELTCLYYILVMYIFCYTDKTGSKKLKDLFKTKKLLITLGIIFLVSIIIFLIFIPYVPFNLANPTFTPKNSTIVSEITVVSMFIITLIETILNRKNLTKLEKITYMVTWGVILTILLLQIKFDETSLTPLGFTTMAYYIYVVIENPIIILRKDKERELVQTDNNFKTKEYLITSVKSKLDLHVDSIKRTNRKLNKEDITREDKINIIKELNDEAREIVNLLDTRINISSLIDDKTINNERYRVRTFIDRIVANAESKLVNRNLDFEYDINANIPFVLSGDINKLSIVLFNIIDNAIYYTKYGKLILNMTFNKLNEKNIELIISITDTGEGMDQDRINEINNSINSITFLKKIVENIGGSLIYESTIGAGSTFYIKVPQEIIDSTPMGGYTKFIDYKGKNIEYTDFSSKRILIVDDNKLSTKTLKNYLYRYNINPECCENGPACIQKVKQGIEFDLIFMDDCMEETTGKDTLELIQKISKISKYRLAPVVVFTANAVNGARDMYLKRGFADYLGKPIDSVELDKILKTKLQK